MNDRSTRAGDAGTGGLFSSEQWNQIGEELDLTAKELLVVKTAFEGRTERHIAERCECSKHTVHTHLGNVYRKLDVHSRHGLMTRVVAAYIELCKRSPQE